MPTFRFLMLGMSRLAMSSTSSASSSSASTTSSKCGGMSTTTKSNIVRSIRTMPIISSAVMRSPAAGSTGAHNTRSDDASCVARKPSMSCVSIVSTTAAASADVCCGGTPSSTASSPNWRSASISAPTGVPGREQHREVGGDNALADATLGGEGDDDLAHGEPARTKRRRAVDDARHRLADALDRQTDLALAGVDRERVANAGTQRVLEERERELVGEQHHTDLGEAARDALHRGEAVGRRQARTEHDDGRLTRHEVAVASSMDLSGAGTIPASSRVMRVRIRSSGSTAEDAVTLRARTVARARGFHHGSLAGLSALLNGYGSSAAGGGS